MTGRWRRQLRSRPHTSPRYYANTFLDLIERIEHPLIKTTPVDLNARLDLHASFKSLLFAVGENIRQIRSYNDSVERILFTRVFWRAHILGDRSQSYFLDPALVETESLKRKGRIAQEDGRIDPQEADRRTIDEKIGLHRSGIRKKSGER